MSTAATDEPEGFYSELERNWLVYPISERKDHGAWYEVGSAGVDGIVFAIRKDQEGVYAFYPIDREFIRKADDLSALVVGWRSGSITV